MEQVEINGLLWDTKNLEIFNQKYFTWEEALKFTKLTNKRLPTKEEFEALIDTGYEFDQERKGMWFADRKLFFPLSGNLYNSSGVFQNVTYGFCWSSTPQSASLSWDLNFSSSNALVNYSNVQYGFPVRCVQDKISNDEKLREKKDISIGDYIFVKWIDSAGSARWTTYYRDEYKTGASQVISCGKLIYEDDNVISLAMSFIEETDYVSPQFHGEIVIPKVSIKDIKVIQCPF